MLRSWTASTPSSRPRALRASRVYAGWGFSQTFYRVEADLKKMGYASLEDFLVGFWEGGCSPRTPTIF